MVPSIDRSPKNKEAKGKKPGWPVAKKEATGKDGNLRSIVLLINCLVY